MAEKAKEKETKAARDGPLWISRDGRETWKEWRFFWPKNKAMVAGKMV